MVRAWLVILSALVVWSEVQLVRLFCCFVVVVSVSVVRTMLRDF